MDKIIETKFIKCPICSTNEYKSVYTKKFYVYMNQGRWIWPTNQVICKNCGIIYTNPQPTKEILELYYRSYSRYGDSFRSFSYIKNQIEFFKRNIPNNLKRVLEIGSFDGTFLNCLKELGFEIHGIEPSKEGVNAALKNYGINLEHTFFDKAYVDKFLASNKEKFDIVLFLHVFEHVPEPLDFLRLVLKITKDNGVIFIEVPDAQRPTVENVADFFSIEHIMYYTESSLRNIAYVLGLDILVIERPIEDSVIRAIFVNKDHNKEKSPQCIKLINEFEQNKQIIERYKIKREEFLNTIRKKLNGLKQVIIYGAGMHTSQLISEGLLDGIEIQAIVDSNPKKWNRNIFGFLIQSPYFLKEAKVPVLISSYSSQEEISRFLTKTYPHIEQIKLY